MPVKFFAVEVYYRLAKLFEVGFFFFFSIVAVGNSVLVRFVYIDRLVSPLV